ncbi:MAG: hypothetical protein IPJ00_21430 [Saprospirales bacterium]|nr:hypothetical protein [Saprospirales bacterium]
MKTDLVNDITAAEGTYWEKQDAIIRELEVFWRPNTHTDKADLAALSTRLETVSRRRKIQHRAEPAVRRIKPARKKSVSYLMVPCRVN